jgi:hypothetical protein
MNNVLAPGAAAPADDGEARTMHHRGDDHRQPRHERHDARERDEPVFTTMAVGEEGDPDSHPDPVHLPPGEPVFTTMAVGEEGDPDSHPDPVRPPPGEPIYTTMAVGEEGDPDPFPEAAGFPEEPVFTTLALGEEGDPGSEDFWCA